MWPMMIYYEREIASFDLFLADIQLKRAHERSDESNCFTLTGLTHLKWNKKEDERH